MADPLATAAQDVVRLRPPETSIFFNPAGEDVLARYARSNQDLANAQGAFNAQNAVENLMWAREQREQQRLQWDRDAQAREEQDAFDEGRTELMESLLSLDPTAADFDEQLTQFMGTAPEVALNDPAITGIIKVMGNRRDRVLADLDKQAADRKAQLEASRAMEVRLRESLASMGADPDVVNGLRAEDGTIDAMKMAELIGGLKFQEAKGKAVNEAQEERRKEIDKTFERDPVLRQALQQSTPEALQSVTQTRAARLKEIVPSFNPTDEDFNLDEDSFIAKATAPVVEGYAPEIDINGRAVDPTAETRFESTLQAAEAAARALHRANRARSYAAAASPATGGASSGDDAQQSRGSAGSDYINKALKLRRPR